MVKAAVATYEPLTVVQWLEVCGQSRESPWQCSPLSCEASADAPHMPGRGRDYHSAETPPLRWGAVGGMEGAVIRGVAVSPVATHAAADDAGRDGLAGPDNELACKQPGWRQHSTIGTAVEAGAAMFERAHRWSRRWCRRVRAQC